MATTQVLGGVLNADGTLKLDDTPHLPPGRVEVVLQLLSPPQPPGEDWWQYLQRVRTEAVAKGESVRIEQEIEAERESFRGGDDEVAGAPTGRELGT